VREIPEDYGIDFEVEIVDKELVTGNRCWFQLKGTTKLNVIKKRYSSSEEYIDIDYVKYKLPVKLLKYSVKCDIPLLLTVINIDTTEIFWLPLRDWIESYLEIVNHNWRNQKTVIVYIPFNNNFSIERKKNFINIKFYAMETIRMRALAILGHYYHELYNKVRLSNYEFEGDRILWGEEEELKESLKTSLIYLNLALELESLFGKKGLIVYVNIAKPILEQGINACKQLLDDFNNNTITFDRTAILASRVEHAINIFLTSISLYQEIKQKYLLINPFYLREAIRFWNSKMEFKIMPEYVKKLGLEDWIEKDEER